MVAAALLAATALAATATAAHAAYPGRNGLIAFERGGDIYTVKPGASVAKRLTTNGRNHQPRWSPDGKRIAFGSQGDIWVMNANGTGVKRVTSGTGRDFNATWSPDGKRVGFARALPATPNSASIWTALVTTGAATRLTTDPAGTCASEPAWSSTGRYVVYQRAAGSCYGDQSIVLYDTTTKKGKVIATGDESAQGVGYVRGNPDFMPDGTHVVFQAANDDIGYCSDNAVVTDLAGKHPNFLTGYYGCEGEAQFTQPAAAPDGTTVTGIVSEPSGEDDAVFGVVGTYFWTGDASLGSPDWQPLR